MNWLDWLKGIFGWTPPAPAPVPRPKPVPLPPPAPVPSPDLNTLVLRIIALHNKYRIEKGLFALIADARLMASAQAHATDMRVHHILSHTGSNGSTPFLRMSRAGYAWNMAAENIAEGQTTPEQVMAAWMNDPPHRQDIMGPYRNVGVGWDNNWWVVDFASPK